MDFIGQSKSARGLTRVTAASPLCLRLRQYSKMHGFGLSAPSIFSVCRAQAEGVETSCSLREST